MLYVHTYTLCCSLCRISPRYCIIYACNGITHVRTCNITSISYIKLLSYILIILIRSAYDLWSASYMSGHREAYFAVLVSLSSSCILSLNAYVVHIKFIYFYSNFSRMRWEWVWWWRNAIRSPRYRCLRRHHGSSYVTKIIIYWLTFAAAILVYLQICNVQS